MSNDNDALVLGNTILSGVISTLVGSIGEQATAKLLQAHLQKVVDEKRPLTDAEVAGHLQDIRDTSAKIQALRPDANAD